MIEEVGVGYVELHPCGRCKRTGYVDRLKDVEE